MIINELKSKIENLVFVGSNIISVLIAVLIISDDFNLANDFEYALLYVTTWFLFTCIIYTASLRFINNAFVVCLKKLERVIKQEELNNKSA